MAVLLFVETNLPSFYFNYLVYRLDMAIVQDLVDKTVCNIYKWTLSGCHDLLQTVSFTIFLFLGHAMYLDTVFFILNILLLKKVKMVFLKSVCGLTVPKSNWKTSSILWLANLMLSNNVFFSFSCISNTVAENLKNSPVFLYINRYFISLVLYY